MDMHTPQAWRSEAFAEDLMVDDSGAPDQRYAWAPHALWLCVLPVAASLLGGAAAFVQTLA